MLLVLFLNSCATCNTALGLAHDDPSLLRALAYYLEGML